MPALRTYRDSLWRVTAPPPPRIDLWPPAVRSAWRLTGAIVPCGPGFRGLGWPETPTVRLAALAEWLRPHQAVTHGTAAWVWGASRTAGDAIEITMVAGRRRPITTAPEVRVRELRVAPDDLERLGDFDVTTPLRTAIDLLYRSEAFTPADAIACRLLAFRFPGGLHRIRAHIGSRRRPGRTMALERLETLLSPR